MRKKLTSILLIGLVCLFVGLTDSWASLVQIEEAIIREDFKKALDLAERQIIENPLDKDIHQIKYYRGLSLLRLQYYSQAEEVFSALIEEKMPDNLGDKAYLGLFNAYYLQEQYHNAHRLIQELLKKSRNSELASLIYLKAARVNLKLAHWSEAQEYLKRIVNRYPESFEAYTAKQLLQEKHYFAVQVGAFMEQERAEQLAEELQGQEEYAYIVETVDRHQRKFYRVRVGQLSLLDDARKLKSKLAQQGYPTQIYP